MVLVIQLLSPDDSLVKVVAQHASAMSKICDLPSFDSPRQTPNNVALSSVLQSPDLDPFNFSIWDWFRGSVMLGIIVP